MSLDGRVYAIAGIGGGLGPVVAQRLAAAGATVAGTDRDQERIDEVGGGLELPAERWDGRAVDLLDEEATRGWCAALLERFGRVDGLLHLVGGWRGGQPLHEAPLADWELLHDLLIRTVQHTTRAFHDALIAIRRTAASSSSPPSRRRRRPTRMPPTPPRRRPPRPGPWPSPTASAGTAATANIVVVDAILTPRMREESPEGDFASFTPAEHIAEAIAFLCSDAARGDERAAPATDLLAPGGPPAAYHRAMANQAAKPAKGEMTIRQLAERTGMTVRNIRAHQTRGLLPPPTVRGRTGYYGEEHVARIELTREMQADGLNLEAIRRVLDSGDGSAAAIFDFTRALRAPFEDEAPEIVDAEELAAHLGRGGGPEADPPRRKARHLPHPARRAGRGDQPAAAARRRRAGRDRHRARGRARHRREAAPPRRRRRPRLRRPLRQGGLAALRPRRPARARLAADARGAGTAAPARRRRAAGDLPDRDGGGGREGERADPAARRPPGNAPASARKRSS